MFPSGPGRFLFLPSSLLSQYGDGNDAGEDRSRWGVRTVADSAGFVAGQAAPRLFCEVMGELFALIAAGVLTPSQPTAYDLADGPKALAELETRATVGKLALVP
jgi:NADPH:quinone reductase-like Zn-dependent oxidoreductase